MSIVRTGTPTNGADTGTTVNVSYTVPAGENRLIVVHIGLISTSDTVTGVTFDGVAMTRINTIASTVNRSYLYYLLAPNVTTANVSISLSSSLFALANIVSYSGVKQVAPTISNTATGEAVTSRSIADTTVDDNSIHLAGFVPDANNASSITNGTILTGSFGESNPLLVTPAGSHTMTANFPANQRVSATSAVFAPAPPTTGGAAFLLNFV